MKIVVTGTRGIPNIMGGVETHCEELFPRIAAMGHEVTVIRRNCYVTDDNRITEYKGVKIKDLYAPRKKSLEAVTHTFLAVIAAKRMKADILHIHAVGPAIMVPFARLLGQKVVMTHHGPDYERQKWGRMARWVLKEGERNGVRYSNEVIAISQTIANTLQREYGRQAHLIFNGVPAPIISGKTDYIASLGLDSQHYIVAVGRFVKEKCFDHLIEAYSLMTPCNTRLVIAGDADHEDEYSRLLKEKARANGVVLTGFIRGEKLSQLLANAALFVLPSSHEGLPISLLEAMSYNRDVLVSDIPANRLPELNPADFFPCGDIKTLSQAIQNKLQKNNSYRRYDLHNYDWDHIAQQTVDIYERILNNSK